MKILFIHNRYHTNLFNWFRGFQQNGHHVSLLVYKPDEVEIVDLPKSEFLNPSFWSTRKMKKNPRTRGDGVDSFSPYYYPSFKTLYRYFKEEQPDLVIIRPAFSRFSYLVVICAVLFRVKKVFYSQTQIHKGHGVIKKLMFEFAMRGLNAHWISPCLGDKERFPFKPKRMLYVPFAMAPKVQFKKERSDKEPIHLLCVAKYYKSKNPELVVKVFLELADKYNDITLTVCGTGDQNGNYYKNLIDIVIKSGYSDKVEFLINKSYSVVQSLYKTSDVFILPSNHDPASITNLEAMSFGLPVICSKANGTAEYTSHGINGFLFDRMDRSQLKSDLEKIIFNRTLISVMGNEALEAVRTNHDGDRITACLLNSIK